MHGEAPRTVRRGLCCALALALACPPTASADDDARIESSEIGALDQQTLDRAESLFFLGLGNFRAGRYEQAVDAFQQCWLLSGHRDLLYNVARSRAKLGDAAGAVEWYRAYLRTQPADETAVLHRIKQLGGDTSGPVDAAAEEPEVADAPVEPAGPRIVEEGAGPWPWVALGAGVAATGAGVVLGFGALDSAARAREATRASDATTHRDESDSQALLSHIALGVGAAGILTAAWLFWEADKEASRKGRVSVGVAPTEGGGAVGLSGIF